MGGYGFDTEGGYGIGGTPAASSATAAFLLAVAETIPICNLALINVGVTNLIASLEERSKEANVLRAIYGLTRDETLEAAPWPFATRRKVLQSVGSPPAEWAYRYRYPNDCLTARRILNGVQRVFASDQRIPFAIEEDEENGAKVVLSDQAPATLEYTARIVNPALFTPTFKIALAWGLAVKIAPPLSADPKFGVAAGQQYQGAINRALARSFAEGQADQDPDSEFTRARL
jgi:hypothetical protein